MTITVELPDDFTEHGDACRAALESLAIAGYRAGSLSALQVRMLLGFETRYELDGFLKKNKVWERSYGIDDYNDDLASIGKFEARETKQS